MYSVNKIGGKKLEISDGNLVLFQDHPTGSNKIQEHYKDKIMVVGKHLDLTVDRFQPVSGQKLI